jgi:hypothetical protein
MELLTFIVLSGTLLTAGLLLHISSRKHTPKPLHRILQFVLCRAAILTNIASEWLERFNYVAFGVPRFQPNTSNERSRTIEKIKALTEHHEVAEILSDMIQKDGAGSWPPNANHDHSTWPLPLQPYKEICLELAHLLPQATPSLDDAVNTSLIKEFRRRFRELLNKRVDLVEVNKVSRRVKHYKGPANGPVSFCKQPNRDVGSISPATHTMPSTVVSLGAGTRIDGPLFLSSRSPN